LIFVRAALGDGRKAEDEMEVKRRRILYAVLGAGALAGILVVGPIAAAVQGGWRHMHGGRGWHGGGSPEAMAEHVQVGLKFALRELDATEEQQQKIGAIAGAAVNDLMALKDRHRANHEQIVAALAGSNVDRAKLEQARQDGIAMVDQASRRLAQAFADAAEVLTPEQREKALEHIRSHHGH
jgi:Spy/CpxP family protein refolding chaperone